MDGLEPVYKFNNATHMSTTDHV